MTSVTAKTSADDDFDWDVNKDITITSASKVVPISAAVEVASKEAIPDSVNSEAKTVSTTESNIVETLESPVVSQVSTADVTVVDAGLTQDEGGDTTTDDDAAPSDIKDALEKLQAARQAAQKKLDDKFKEKEFNLRRKAMGASARKTIALDAMESMRQDVRECINEPYTEDPAVDELIKKAFAAGLSSLANVAKAS